MSLWAYDQGRDGLSANMKVTTTPKPKYLREVIEYNVKSRDQYLVDVPVFLRQHGLDQ